MMRKRVFLIFVFMTSGAILGSHHNRDHFFMLERIGIALFRLMAIVTVNPRLTHNALVPLIINAGSGFTVACEANFTRRRAEFLGVNIIRSSRLGKKNENDNYQNNDFNSVRIRQNAERFSNECFLNKFKSFVDSALEEHNKNVNGLTEEPVFTHNRMKTITESIEKESFRKLVLK